MVTNQDIAVQVPDSYRATERNGNMAIISAG